MALANNMRAMIIDAVPQVATVLFVTLAPVPSLAHALELPGKMRLNKASYRTVQPIYYPGFTAAGIAEPAGIIATPLGVLPRRAIKFRRRAPALALARNFGKIVSWLSCFPL